MLREIDIIHKLAKTENCRSILKVKGIRSKADSIAESKV